jgi:NitT/TauT family transport system ATP-binding protein
MATEAEAAVEIAGASLVYPDGTRALAPVDLTVHKREFLTLLGPSGCGKSTLLKMVAGLLPPSTGRVQRFGEAELAYVFQEATLMPWHRLRANVRLPLDLAGMENDDAAKRVDAALALVGLTGFENHFPRQLSGGMQMRASIARALVNEPQLLLMDEPFGALDEITRARLDSDILELWRRRALTILFVTHSVYEAVYLSTRIVVMAARPGRVIAEIAVDQPYPRTEAFRTTPAYNALCVQVSGALHAAAATHD